MLRVSIIGCGKIADQHVGALQRIPDCKLVSVCDREPLMAEQLGERFRISECYSDAEEMLRKSAPDVVHITTPPQGHFSLAKACIDAGCHVYIEKPFTVTAPEAEQLVRLAEARGRKLTAGHNLQFTPEMLKMRQLVKDGFLGGKPVHVESHFSYRLTDPTYVGPLLGSKKHWVRQLPGQLLHNIVSHGIAKMAEHLDDDLVQVVAMAHQSPTFKSMEGNEVLDELRVMIRDKSGTTAFFCFSTQVAPPMNLLRICGPAGTLVVDHGSGSLIRLSPASHKSYLTFFVPPLQAALEHFRNAKNNVVDFCRGRLFQDSGMKVHIETFYQSIQSGGPLPLSYREILLTARIMDEVFAQIYAPTSVEESPTRVPSLV